MQIFQPKALSANKALAINWVFDQFPALKISNSPSDTDAVVRVSASTDASGFMLYNPKKETYGKRIKNNLLPEWMEDRYWLRGLIVVRDMRTSDDEPGRFIAYFLPRVQWLPLIQTLSKRAGAKWPQFTEYATARMIGETDLNGTWLGWISGTLRFEEELVEAGCLDKGSRSALSDDQLFTHIESIDADRALSEIEKISARKERIGHSQWATDVKSRAGYRCQFLPVLHRNLVAGHIKPWSVCAGGEHLDRANGFCFSPSIDKLFEDGLIGLTDEGQLLVNGLSEEELRTYGLSKQCSIRLAEGQQAYLQWHREKVMGIE
tara:strand:+ start:485 stop:1444 length:960 start_codon:yes stop_codon:yes gene_type:complete